MYGSTTIIVNYSILAVDFNCMNILNIVNVMKRLAVAFTVVAILVFSLLPISHAFDNSKERKNGFVSPDKLEIISSAFAADPYSKAQYDPIIKIRVYNNSTAVITRAFMNVVLKSDDGKTTVYSEKFMKIINGGLKPYSYAMLRLYPKTSGFWAMHNIPYDASLEVSTYKLFCPKGNSPWNHEFKFRIPDRYDYSY